MRKLLIAFVVLMVVACGKEPGNLQPATLDDPVNLAVKSLGTTEVTLQWNPVAGADTYEWKVSDAADEVASGTGLKNRNVTVKGLTPGTAYVFGVRAVSADAVSGWTNLDFTTEGKAPGPEDALLCVDAPLVVEVGAGARLGTSGLIQVFRADGSLVDKIDLAHLAKVTVLEDGTMVPSAQMTGTATAHTFQDNLRCGTASRAVHYTPLRLADGKLEIKLHSGVLGFGDSYYLTMDASVAGKAIGPEDMPFATKSSPSGATLKVAADGSGDFCTVQGALNHALSLGKDTAVTIEVGEGTYRELLFLQGKNNLTVRGVSREKTVIAYPNSELYWSGSDNRCLFLVKSCDNLVLENLTLENTFYAADHKGQAETIYFNSNYKLTVESCALISWQDTFLCKGEVWVHNSLIAGHCDYIWGYPKACLFEDCEIRSRAAGYIVQARVPDASYKGFVFLNCRLTAESGVKDGSMYLARSGGDSSVYDNVTYVNCTMGPVIRPEGWLGSPAPTPAKPTATSGWKEYGTQGVSTASRNAFGKILSADEAAAFASRQAVLGW